MDYNPYMVIAIIFFLIAAFIYTLYLAANLILIIPILRNKELRCHPQYWLLITLSLFLMFEAVPVLLYIPKFVDLPSPYEDLGYCEWASAFYMVSSYAVPIMMLLVTIERFISITKHSGTKDGFTKGAVIAIIISMVVFVIVMLCVIAVVLEAGYIDTSNEIGVNTCEFDPGFYGCIIFSIVYVFVFIPIFILTILLIIKKCKTESTLVKQAVCPLVAVNITFLIFWMPSISPEFINGLNIFRLLNLIYDILIPLLWVTCSDELRRNYKKVCCACCPGGNAGDNVETKEVYKNNHYTLYTFKTNQ